MNLVSDLEELAAKAESVLAGAKNVEPTLADKLLQAVVGVLEAEGWTAPAAPEAPADPNQPQA